MSGATSLDAPKWDAMASHDWKGADGKNHTRVVRVVKSLRRAGLRCWLDEDELKGNVDVNEKMMHGVHHSAGFLAFITKNYHDKVKGDCDGDNCKIEFRTALAKKTVGKMLAVIMEEEMCKDRAWEGLMANLSGRMNFRLMDLDRLSDPELDSRLRDGLIPLMTWLQEDPSATPGELCTLHSSLSTQPPAPSRW